jgi:hypothetical protein
VAARKQQPSMKSTAKEIIGVKEETTPSVAPKTIGRYPLPDQTDIGVNSPIAATFSKPVDSPSITKDTFTVRKDGSNVNIDAEEIKLEENSQTAIFRPKESLEKNTKNIVTLSREVKDQAGSKMASDEIWSFTTTTT